MNHESLTQMSPSSTIGGRVSRGRWIEESWRESGESERECWRRDLDKRGRDCRVERISVCVSVCVISLTIHQKGRSEKYNYGRVSIEREMGARERQREIKMNSGNSGEKAVGRERERESTTVKERFEDVCLDTQAHLGIKRTGAFLFIYYASRFS